MALTHTTTHVTEALAHRIEQFKDAPNMAAFITAFVEQVQDIEDAAWELYTERWLDTAVGVQLDGVGAIVDEDREGRSDDDYRLAIKARIQINASSGTPEDIIKSFTNFYSAAYELIELPPAAVVVRLAEAFDVLAMPSYLEFVALLGEINAAGVAAYFQAASVDDDRVFEFASGDTEESSTTKGLGDDLRWVAVSSDGTPRAMWSINRDTWIDATVPVGIASSSWRSVSASTELGVFVAVANSGTTRAMYSDDGKTWVAGSISSESWVAVEWSPTLRLFVALAYNSATIATSTDGITWTDGTGISGAWRALTWSPELCLFCAIASSGATRRVMTSPDGVTWTLQSEAESNEWQGICWSADLELFVAVGQTGTNRVMTSPDGVTWTARAIAAAAWKSVIWNSVRGLFVAVSVTPATDVATSPDGITWTAYSTGLGPTWYAIEEFGGQMAVISTVGTCDVGRSDLGTPGTWESTAPPQANTWTGLKCGFSAGGVWSEIVGI